MAFSLRRAARQAQRCFLDTFYISFLGRFFTIDQNDETDGVGARHAVPGFDLKAYDSAARQVAA